MPVNIHGKSYKTVAERVQEVNAETKGLYSVQTSYDFYPDHKMWVVRAVVTLARQEGKPEYTYTGLAQEIETEDARSVNSTSALENAETSAIGRALAAAGYAGTEYASADELAKSANRKVINPDTGEITVKKPEKKYPEPIKFTPEYLKEIGENGGGVITKGNKNGRQWIRLEFKGDVGFLTKDQLDYMLSFSQPIDNNPPF